MTQTPSPSALSQTYAEILDNLDSAGTRELFRTHTTFLGIVPEGRAKVGILTPMLAKLIRRRRPQLAIAFSNHFRVEVNIRFLMSATTGKGVK